MSRVIPLGGDAVPRRKFSMLGCKPTTIHYYTTWDKYHGILLEDEAARKSCVFLWFIIVDLTEFTTSLALIHPSSRSGTRQIVRLGVGAISSHGVRAHGLSTCTGWHSHRGFWKPKSGGTRTNLVGGWALPLWKMMEFVSWDDFPFPIYGKKCSKPPEIQWLRRSKPQKPDAESNTSNISNTSHQDTQGPQPPQPPQSTLSR